MSHPRSIHQAVTGTPAILAEGVRQTFGDVVALDGLDLESVPAGVSEGRSSPRKRKIPRRTT